jgi:hypothetical protein
MPSFTTAAPCLPLAIKDSLKEDTRPFALVLFVFLTGKAFGFWMKEGFLLWEALEGKEISKGKRIAEGELLNRD